MEVIKKFARRGFPFTKNRVMSLVYQYAEMNGRKGFSKITKQAGRWWLKDFLKRFPEVRLKKGHNLSVNRAMCANKPTIDKFFNLYQDLLQKLNIKSPMHIWNTDESGVQDVPKEERVIGVTGEKAHTMSPKEQGETTTLLTFANACGQVFPPLVIFKGAKVSDAWQTNAPPNVTVRASPKGWINKDVFLNYAVRWVHWLKRNQRLGKPHLLLLDAHKSHIYNLPFLLLMTANKIEVLAIPGHTSHILQPLDSTPFANFKTNWNIQLREYLFQNVGMAMPKHDFWIPFVPAWRKSLTVAAIQSGFRKTGIFPVNRNAIKISDLSPSGATDNLANLQGNDRQGKICIPKQCSFHFVIKCFISCRVFVLIVKFPVVFR